MGCTLEVDALCQVCIYEHDCRMRDLATELERVAATKKLRCSVQQLDESNHVARCEQLQALIKELSVTPERVVLIRACVAHDEWNTGSCYTLILAGSLAAKKLRLGVNAMPQYPDTYLQTAFEPGKAHHETFSSLCQQLRRIGAKGVAIVRQKKVVGVLCRVDCFSPRKRPPE